MSQVVALIASSLEATVHARVVRCDPVMVA
jgi:hypothetical protein